MDSHIHGNIAVLTILLILFIFSPPIPAALSNTTSSSSLSSAAGGGGQINSNSVLVALLDSHYTELAELVEKALLLHALEDAVASHNLTIFAPKNQALDHHLDPEFKRFLLEPRNLPSLQNLILSHILPRRVTSADWPRSTAPAPHQTLCRHTHLGLAQSTSGDKAVDLAAVTRPDDVVRPDGVIHGIERLLVPRLVQEDFNRRRSLRSISAVKPEGAPVVDARTHRLKKPAPAVPAGAPPALPIFDAMAPGPDISPAPAPGPGGPRGHFDGESHVKDFIHTLLHYGGYSEIADILVNLTSLASEIGKLVSEGYVLTILAPNDEAMARLAPDDLGEPGAAEKIVYYHIIPEYQTEESMYNAVRRFRKVRYDTLQVPHKLVAEEADGSVKFGQQADAFAYLFDPDIFTDGRISVQGVDRVLFPATAAAEADTSKRTKVTVPVKVVKQRRGRLLEVACRMLGAFGTDSQFTSCQ